jgi:WD40 repeat protein
VLWNITDPNHPSPIGSPLTVQNPYVYSVAFSPDGKTLASGTATNSNSNSNVVLWNITDPNHPSPIGSPLTVQNPNVYSVAFSPDGKTLAGGTFSGADDGKIFLIDIAQVSLKSPESRACSIAKRGLSRTEWKMYILHFGYRDTCRQ